VYIMMTIGNRFHLQRRNIYCASKTKFSNPCFCCLLLYSGGYSRDAWLFSSDVSEFAYKRLRLNDDFGVDYRDMYKTHRDAIVMERLTNSPRIVDIYGHCSTTIISEPMPSSDVSDDIIPGDGSAKQADLDKLDDVYPQNNLTATQKLEMSLEMAEGLADIHGFEGGVIMHGDIHLEQFLWSKNGRLLLNDFNNAEILDWDEENQRYCGSWRQYGGSVRIDK
jgi:serine/threonine protein kinase